MKNEPSTRIHWAGLEMLTDELTQLRTIITHLDLIHDEDPAATKHRLERSFIGVMAIMDWFEYENDLTVNANEVEAKFKAHCENYAAGQLNGMRPVILESSIRELSAPNILYDDPEDE